MKEILFEANFIFRNLDKHKLLKNFERTLGDNFINHRHEVCKIFNSQIDRINKLWDLTGREINNKGKYAEDIDPIYSEFVKLHLQPYIDELNKKNLNNSNVLWEYYLDEYCDICGRLKK